MQMLLSSQTKIESNQLCQDSWHLYAAKEKSNLIIVLCLQFLSRANFYCYAMQ